MLSPDGKSDRFLATKETKLVGQRHGKFVFCYVQVAPSWKAMTDRKLKAVRSCQQVSQNGHSNARLSKSLGLKTAVGVDQRPKSIAGYRNSTFLIDATGKSLPAIQSDLDRNDVLDLMNIASGMEPEAISELLTKFCQLVPPVRFASLWQLNQCSNTISIRSRSKSEYAPQLGARGEYYQEFVCGQECPAVSNIVAGEDFLNFKRSDHSILASKAFGVFHPEDVVADHNLDNFVCLPIAAKHDPKTSGKIDDFEGPGPRFFCLFYCEPNFDASDVADVDLKLIERCLGNMLYNAFNEKRIIINKSFTEFLTTHHDIDDVSLLNKLKKDCIPSQAVVRLQLESKRRGTIKMVSATDNQIKVSYRFARAVWDSIKDQKSAKIPRSVIDRFAGCPVESAIAYQQKNHDERARVIILFCNKVTQSPLRKFGEAEFVDRFGFDDVLMLNDVGEHIRAFTETISERKRRDDAQRIVAHETKQPLIDIRNSLDKHKYNPKVFGLGKTMERIDDAAELALILTEMNTDFTDDSIKRLARTKHISLDVEQHLNRMKRSLRRLCEDSDFKNDNIQIAVDPKCKQMSISRPLLATLFVNTVSNSIKYNNGDFDGGWCNIRLAMIDGINHAIWRQYEVPKRKRRPCILLTATDNGRGVPASMLTKVFEKEQRLEDNSNVPGLGLGLYHTRRVVRALGGEVWMTSTLGADGSLGQYSTRVYVSLPTDLVKI